MFSILQTKNLIKSFVRYFKWKIEKRKILREVKAFYKDDISLDVIKKYSYFIFFNKNNTLIKRGSSFEPEVQQALYVLISLDKLRNKQTVLADIGANIGLHTFFVKSLFDLPIVAFDPAPNSWKYLDLTIYYNNLSDIKIEKIALSDENGILDFYNWGEETSADSLRDTGRVPGVIPNIIKVPVKRLDDIDDLPEMTVWKMDCEGSELSILKGSKKTIIKNKPLIVSEFYLQHMRVFNVTCENVFEVISEIDYSIYDLKFNKLDIINFIDLQNKYYENYILLPNNLVLKK